MSQPAFPYHRYSSFAEQLGNGAVTLVGANQFAPAIYVLEGLDLLNHDLSVGSRAIGIIQGTGPSATFTEFFQGVTYDTSQAVFSWRGNMVIFPNFSLQVLVESGEWFATQHGHVEPQYSLSP